MKMFDIRLTGPLVEGSRLGNAAMQGRIVLGEEEEEFESFIGFWGPLDYARQWTEGAVRVASQRSASCLLTSVTDPSHSEFIRWWLLYPRGETVIVQEGILLLASLSTPFSTTFPYASVPEYESTAHDGRPIAEWQIPRDAIAEFATRRSGGS